MRSSLWVAAQLRLRGYRHTKEIVERIQPRRRKPPVPLLQISEVTNGVLRRVPWAPNCLERSLVLIKELRRGGNEPVMRLGVRRQKDALEFHAWVEVEGRVVGDSDDFARSFRPFGEDELPPDATFV